MQTITLEVPDTVDAKEVRFMVFASMFGKGLISSGRAASILGMTRINFLSEVGKYGISIFSDDESDLERAMNIEL